MKTLILLLVAIPSFATFAHNDLELSQNDLPKEKSSTTVAYKDTSLSVYKFMQVEIKAPKAIINGQSYSEKFDLVDRDGQQTTIDLSLCVTMKYYLDTKTDCSVGIQFADISGNWSDVVPLAVSKGKGYREFTLQQIANQNTVVDVKNATTIRIIVNSPKNAIESDFYIDELAFVYITPPIEKPTGGWKKRQKKVKENYQDQGLKQFNDERGRKARERAQ